MAVWYLETTTRSRGRGRAAAGDRGEGRLRRPAWVPDRDRPHQLQAAWSRSCFAWPAAGHRQPRHAGPRHGRVGRCAGIGYGQRGGGGPAAWRCRPGARCARRRGGARRGTDRCPVDGEHRAGSAPPQPTAGGRRGRCAHGQRDRRRRVTADAAHRGGDAQPEDGQNRASATDDHRAHHRQRARSGDRPPACRRCRHPTLCRSDLPGQRPRRRRGARHGQHRPDIPRPALRAARSPPAPESRPRPDRSSGPPGPWSCRASRAAVDRAR